MGQLVALATFVSFIVAPIIGYMNYKNVTSDDLPLEHRPNRPLKILTYSGIIFLSLFSYSPLSSAAIFICTFSYLLNLIQE